MPTPSEALVVEPQLVERYVMELAQHGASDGTGVRRPVYSPEWEAAQRQIERWCADSGLRSWRDAVGNVWGRLEGREPGPVIATGSHVDTQLPGGRYDGALGIIGGVLALQLLKERFGTPRRSIDVVSFCQEESSRFPGANFFASRAVVGTIAPDEPDTMLAYDGQTWAAIMRSVGLDPALVPTARRDDIDTFIELHIEQGPILEHEGLAVGIVDAITGMRTYTVEIIGHADHAGAFPMDLRRDPMQAAAPIIGGVLQTARAMGRPAVTTVGRMHVEPNYPAIVPARVTFTVNARHPYHDGGRELFARHEALFAAVRDAHPELQISWSYGGDGVPTACDPGTVRLLEEVAREQGLNAKTMPSGAGHDCQIMAQRYKSAMIFVQSKDGRSHTPDEYSSPEHLALGVQLLAAALQRLAY